MQAVSPLSKTWNPQNQLPTRRRIEASHACRSEQETLPERASGGLKKGLSLVYLRNFVIRRLGPLRWETLLSALDPLDRRLLAAMTADEWCELGLHARVNRALWSLFDDDGFRLMRELGRYSAERDLTTVHRWLLRLFKPSTVLKNMNFYWRRTDETGELSSCRDGDTLVVRLAGWGVAERVLCERFLGYLSRMLECSGPVMALEHAHRRAEHKPVCEFRLRWLLTADEPWKGSLRSRIEVPMVLRELEQCADLDTFTEAVAGLLRSGLQCRSVTMWVKTPDADALHLLRVSGESPKNRCQPFLLEAEGRLVGRIDVEPPDGQMGSRLAKVLDNLLPCIASRLERLCLSRRDDGSLELAHRIDEHAKMWDLSPRQREVLKLVADGLTNKEIAEELGCSEGTVETHMSRILAKSGADSRTMLVSWVWSSPARSSQR